MEWLMLKMQLQHLATWCKELTHLARLWQEYTLIIPAWFFFIFSRCMVKMFFNSYPDLQCISWQLLAFKIWVISSFIILNYFSGKHPISSSLVCFGGFLSCTFTSYIFPSLLILFILLWFGSPFCRLEGYGSNML